jgi:hypothetical protein
VVVIALGGLMPALPAAGETPSDTATADQVKLEEVPIRPGDRDHWAYRPLVRPPLPDVPVDDDLRTGIDTFLHARWVERGIRPVPEASRQVLLRRLTLSLTGIPPTPDELEAFLADSSAHAYERVVDRLLASPRFGERWALFWLDLARFAETDGYEFDKARPHAWQYRDWVIGAANDDLPYDQFVRQQLAGDELYGDEAPEAIATAFCLSGPDMPDINSQEERRNSLLNELTGTVGAVFLATQIGCAQCHEHRFDPISQADFFRLRSFFESAVRVERDRSIHLLQTYPDKEPLTTRIAIRGDWRRPGPVVEPKFLRAVDWAESTDELRDESGSLSARTALADWMVHSRNPLTARVVANRVWQFHFGRGLCATPSDFGLAGDDPTHPELLDFLAVELRDSGWSLKQLHRDILLSAAYRRTSYLDEQDGTGGARNERVVADWQHNLEADPTNRWFSRFPRKRLEGEFIRDSMLAVAGMLDERMGGPGVRPTLPDELRGTLLRGQWDVTEEESEHYRRSIYVFARRNLRYPIFDVFDRPDPNQSCPRRHTSTTAPQSLLLLNSEFSWEMARRLAERVWAEETSERAIRRAMQWAWGREPAGDEVARATEFLASCHDEDDVIRGRAKLCLAILNSSEFLYID